MRVVLLWQVISAGNCADLLHRRRHVFPRDSLALLDFSSAQACWCTRLTPSQSHLFPTLSSTSPASLYALPSGVALTDLTEDELVKRAQIVDTALFKSYLIGRPSMLGPLCRLPNWCEVEEVEEELRAREVSPISRYSIAFLYP